MFRFGNFITEYIKVKNEKVEQIQFWENFLGKFVFHEAKKKLNSLRFVIIVNHFTSVVGKVVNILFVGFWYKKHYI